MGNRASKLKRHTAEKQSMSAAMAKEQTPPTVTKLREPQHVAKAVFLTRSEINQKPPESFPDTSKGRLTWTTLLSSGLTASDKLTAGIATCPPSVGFLGHHRHEQAELYFILEGEGLMKVDDVEQRIEKGEMVFIPGNAEHGISNLNGEKDLVWLYCFPTDRFEDVVYKFSDEEEEEAMKPGVTRISA